MSCINSIIKKTIPVGINQVIKLIAIDIIICTMNLLYSPLYAFPRPVIKKDSIAAIQTFFSAMIFFTSVNLLNLFFLKYYTKNN